MRHQIGLYQSDMDAFKKGPTNIFISWCVLAGAAIANAVFLAAFWYVVPIVSVIHFLLWITNERWGMEKGEVEYWKKYRSLDASTQKRINLSREYFMSLPVGEDWTALKSNIDNLVDAQKERKRLDGTDETLQYRDKFAEAIRDEREAAQIAKSVRAELESRGF